MKAAVIVFPGSNCDRDVAVALKAAGASIDMVWHKADELPSGIDLVALPGGFSWGDYLRCGAMAARAPIMPAVRKHIERGGLALGICNGFQILLEAGLLPGALMRNAGLRFVCRTAPLVVGTEESPFLAGYQRGGIVQLPIAHHDGNYVAEPAVVDRLRTEDRVALRYLRDENGSVDRIAGILSENRRVLGLMPHPERAADPQIGSSDGAALFASMSGALGAAA